MGDWHHKVIQLSESSLPSKGILLYIIMLRQTAESLLSSATDNLMSNSNKQKNYMGMAMEENEK